MPVGLDTLLYNGQVLQGMDNVKTPCSQGSIYPNPAKNFEVFSNGFYVPHTREIFLDHLNHL